MDPIMVYSDPDPHRSKISGPRSIKLLIYTNIIDKDEKILDFQIQILSYLYPYGFEVYNFIQIYRHHDQYIFPKSGYGHRSIKTHLGAAAHIHTYPSLIPNYVIL